MRRQAARVNSRTEIAISSLDTALNGWNFGCSASASRTCPGGLVHSIPQYRPSVFWRKITASTRGSSKPPPAVRRMKLRGLPGKERQGRMQTSRLKVCRKPTIGL